MQIVKKYWLYIIPVVLLVVSFVSAALIFQPKQSQVAEATPTSVTEEDDSLIKVDPALPKTEACPLNGVMYTKPEQESWATRRPLAVMIENSQEARPQSGLNNADIVFEAVAEGGITRFMAMYYCDAQKNDVLLAPIRSARTYYIQLASGFNRPMYVHVGGANVEGPTNALGQLADYGWNVQNDINQFSVGYPTFIRDYNRIPGKEVATEHTMTTTTEKLWEVAAKREWTNMSPDRVINKKTVAGEDWQEGYTGWTFGEGMASGDPATSLNYEFWSGMNGFNVSWSYDAASNKYLRSNGGETQTDLNTGEQLAFENVIAMFTKETGPLNDQKHMMYEVIGKGTGALFSGGKAQEINWEKKTRESELVFTDKSGKTLTIPRGKVWISVIPTTSEVVY